MCPLHVSCNDCFFFLFINVYIKDNNKNYYMNNYVAFF